MTAQHIEVARAVVGRHQVNAWLEHHLAVSLCPEGLADGMDDFRPREVQCGNVMAGDESQLQPDDVPLASASSPLLEPGAVVES